MESHDVWGNCISSIEAELIGKRPFGLTERRVDIGVELIKVI